MLSADVVRRIASCVDQPTRVACCLATKAMHAALMHPVAWRRAVVYRLDEHAERFLCVARPRVLHIVCDDVRAVERFLESLIARGMRDVVTVLRLSLGRATMPRACTLMDCVSDFTALVDLSIECEDLPCAACLAFPTTCAGLQSLQSLAITEHVSDAAVHVSDAASAPPARKLEVYVGDARLPELAEVSLRVATSDIMAQAWRLPALRVLSYWCDAETYEDARLDGARLSLVSVNVPTQHALEWLMAAVGMARHVDTLMLRCYDDCEVTTYVPVVNLHVKLFQRATEVCVLHPVVRCLESVTIEHACPASQEWTARFVSVGSWHNFQHWAQRTDLRVGHNGSVMIHV